MAPRVLASWMNLLPLVWVPVRAMKRLPGWIRRESSWMPVMGRLGIVETTGRNGRNKSCRGRIGTSFSLVLGGAVTTTLSCEGQGSTGRGLNQRILMGD